LPRSVSEATAFCYYLVYPETKAGDPRVMAFRDWILAEVSGEEQAMEAAGTERPDNDHTIA
jgi:hypothetical protein